MRNLRGPATSPAGVFTVRTIIPLRLLSIYTGSMPLNIIKDKEFVGDVSILFSLNHKWLIGFERSRIVLRNTEINTDGFAECPVGNEQ